MVLRIISAVLLIVWLVQILRGKGGFTHVLLLTGAAIIVVQLTAFYRRRLN